MTKDRRKSAKVEGPFCRMNRRGQLIAIKCEKCGAKMHGPCIIPVCKPCGGVDVILIRRRHVA